ncbi:ADP-ribosyltransferase [Vagococcus fluvialis]|uniref:ADP-ribosyltransferase n=1 Tax=Vagococcus fluvialis TaxID=2738 RepID=UPI0037984F5C
MEDEAIEFAKNNINESPVYHKPTDTEYVVASSSMTINDRFRINDGNHYDFEHARYIEEKYCLKNDIVVYRGVSQGPYEKMIIAAKGVKGIDFLEKGFLNTSIVKEKQIAHDIQLRIYIPKGTPAYYVGNISGEEELYYEVIVQIGAKLKIVSMDNQYINCKLIQTSTFLHE